MSVQTGEGASQPLGQVKATLPFLSHQGNTEGFLMEEKVWETESSRVSLCGSSDAGSRSQYAALSRASSFCHS